jgi:hypothetical protein
LGVLLLADDPVAADSTIVRFMGLLRDRIRYLGEAARFLGNLESARIQEIGESISNRHQAFLLLRP